MNNSKSSLNLVYSQTFNPFVNNVVENNHKCLDIGCWNGNLGKQLINKKKCIVDGIDKDKKALLEAVKNGYKNIFLINLNDENYNFDIIKNKYDSIVLADVLEHLIDPKKLLILASRKLKKEGKIIVSIPNGAFILLRLFWLLGKIDYSDKGGLMDETHLRFFTQRTVINLISESGFKVISFKGYAVLKKFKFLQFVFNLFPSITGPQFLIIAKLKN